MKKIFLLCLIVGLVGCGSNKRSVASDESVCRDVMFVAESVMEAKQKGSSLSEMLELNDRLNKSENPAIHKVAGIIIRDAYTKPNYSTPSLKLEQKNEFAAEYYMDCMK